MSIKESNCRGVLKKAEKKEEERKDG